MCIHESKREKERKNGPDEDYNALQDFSDRETETHIITRWMTFVGMTDMEGKV